MICQIVVTNLDVSWPVFPVSDEIFPKCTLAESTIAMRRADTH